MTNEKEELIYLSTLIPTEIVTIFNEIFKNNTITRVSGNDTEYRKEIRAFLKSKKFGIKLKKLEDKDDISNNYQRGTDGNLVLYCKIKKKEIIENNKDIFNDVYFNYNNNDGDVETIAGKQDEQNLSEFEEDDKNSIDKTTIAEQAAQSQAAIEESSKVDKQTKAEEAIRAKISAELGKEVQEDKAYLDNLNAEKKLPPPEGKKDKPQQETKIQKFNQYKKVTRQNLTDKPKKAQVKGNTDTQITKEKDKPIKTLVKEKTEKQVTNEVKHGMFNHEKKQEAAFQKYAQGKNHMTRFNTNMAEALKIRINQGFSPFSH
jgi:hypothetical protein